METENNVGLADIQTTAYIMNPRGTAHIPQNILFQWHITERCNLRCTHCYQESQAPPELTHNEYLAILEKFCSFIRSCRQRSAGRPFRAHVTVTGGEPFVRDDFMPLLEKLSGNRDLFSFAILTNGTLLSPAVVKSLKKLQPRFVQVSIDGTQDAHDRIRGGGNYEKAVASLRDLVGAGIPSYISFTAHRDNYRDFSTVARLGNKLGVTRIWADRMVPCGSGSSLAENVLTPDETREFIGIMERESRSSWFRYSRVKLHRSLQFTATGATPYRCSAGDTLVTVLANGDVCPCRRMPIVVGNMLEHSLEDLYQDSKIFRNLRDRGRVSKGCEKCFYARTCGGGSRCIACAVHGDPFNADPGCWLANRTETTTTIYKGGECHD